MMAHIAVAAHSPTSHEGTYWLALALTAGLGPARIKKLIERYGTAEHVFQASLTELEATGMQAVSAQSLATGKSLELAQEECTKAVEAGAKIIALSDPEYPVRLKEIYDPPVILFVRGSIEVLAQPGIAMVGTRHPTPYGSGMAERLSTDLASRGLVVISGLARGIDTASHRGGGQREDCRDSRNRDQRDLSERKLAACRTNSGAGWRAGFGVSGWDRADSAELSDSQSHHQWDAVGVLVVEAAEYSGTRITSRCALEQNRDVYAVPGNVTNKNAWGPNTLIKQGAKLVATWEDVWEELPTDIQLALSAGRNESPEAETASLFPDEATSPHEKKIMKLLKADESTHIDQLVELLEAEMSSSEIFAALFELELGEDTAVAGEEFCQKLLALGF